MSHADPTAPLLRVVLIDDTPDIRLLLRRALEAGGRFRVVAEAGDGAAGIEEVARARPDVVLVDLAMPVLDGLDALPALRRACPAARIVVLSGFDSSRLLARTSAAGADGYLQKGLDPWELEVRLLRITTGAPALPTPRRRPPADLVERAPFGVLTLAAPDLGTDTGTRQGRRGGGLRVLGANATARALLGTARTEDGDVRPPAELQLPAEPQLPAELQLAAELQLPAELADAVHAHAATLLAGGEPIELDVPRSGGTLRVTLAPAPQGVAAYLMPAPGDDGPWLRDAVARAVHEIRNPAVVISGVVAALLGRGPGREVPGEAEREELLQALARQAGLLDRATGDLLAAAQVQRGALHVDARTIALADVLRSALADAPGGELVTLDCAPELAVHADPVRVQQMVHNLLTNAAKYGAPPVTVLAHAEVDADGDGYIRVTVADAGAGVPDDLVPSLFEEFSRGPGEVALGAGLGLSVVRSLAVAQGGRAWYEPRQSGAAFAFTLPAAPCTPSGLGQPGLTQEGLPRSDLDAMGAAR